MGKSYFAICFFICMLVVLTAGIAVTSAEDATNGKTDMQYLEGSWIGRGSASGMSGYKEEVSYTFNASRTILTINLKMYMNDKLFDEGGGFIGYDPVKKIARMFSYANQGFMYESWEVSREGNTTLYEAVSYGNPMMPKEFGVRIVNVDENTHTWTMLIKTNGEYQEMETITYTRVTE